ncbi:MAG: cytochrome P450 [Gammaproteobacteria bacterium]|nr:cytochrome P450 [Gammaproteobacteria bacterium]
MSEAKLDSKYSIPDAYSLPLDAIDVSDFRLFEQDAWGPYFKRLREEDPVHVTENELHGRFWSVTKFNDIMYVDTNHELFSSEPNITIDDQDEEFPLPMFIAMDQPKHDEQRKVAQPVVAPMNLAKLEGTIRTRVQNILDSLPVGEKFNWVDKVSIELTTQMLATLFDFPFEDRRKLTFWSDMATANLEVLGITEDERKAHLLECLEYFTRLWNERVNKPPGEDMDLVSMLAHGESTKNMQPMEYLGNLILLIVGGNDTTRNSISGGVVFLNQNPKEYQKLRDDPKLIPNMVSEIIRYQTPLAHMRRIATQDTELGGKQIKKGEKVVMWYVSGNRDAEVIDRPDEFLIDRPKARHHVSFGFGIHRCMGNRLAEMQLRILWEEIGKRFKKIELVGEPVRIPSAFVKGYTDLPVVLHAI